MLLATMFGLHPFLKKLFADAAYQGPQFHNNLARVSGSTAVEDLPRTGRTSIARASHSCALPQSASCCENSVIPLDVLGQTLRR